MKYDFNNILIEPAVISYIVSRYNDVNPFILINDRKYLPIMTAPMDTVINHDNYSYYNINDIIPVLPRNINYFEQIGKLGTLRFSEQTNNFFSFGLSDFEKLLDQEELYIDNVLLDIANGHMNIIQNLARRFKKKFPEVKLMVGNIANPETYIHLANTESIDFVRCGIGNGGGCLTTKSTSIGYPMASLIIETREIKNKLEKLNSKRELPNIVADGGMKDYSDIVKALALGADFVMVGSLFNKCVESAGENYYRGKKISQEKAIKLYNKGIKTQKMFRGMSTKEAQKDLGVKNLKTSEGVVRYHDVEYSIAGWVENFKHYLRSAMSYTDSRNLNEFIGKVNYNIITSEAYERFNK